MRQSFILLLVLAILAKEIAGAASTDPIPTNTKFHDCKTRVCGSSSNACTTALDGYLTTMYTECNKDTDIGPLTKCIRS